MPAAKGTFHEIWTLRWEPGYAIRLIEAGVLGTTIEEASAAKLRQLAAESNDLRELAGYLQDAMLAELGGAADGAGAPGPRTWRRWPRMSPCSWRRFRNLRRCSATATSARPTRRSLPEIVDGIVPRITAGLGGAVAV